MELKNPTTEELRAAPHRFLENIGLNRRQLRTADENINKMSRETLIENVNVFSDYIYNYFHALKDVVTTLGEYKKTLSGTIEAVNKLRQT